MPSDGALSAFLMANLPGSLAFAHTGGGLWDKRGRNAWLQPAPPPVLCAQQPVCAAH